MGSTINLTFSLIHYYGNDSEYKLRKRDDLHSFIIKVNISKKIMQNINEIIEMKNKLFLTFPSKDRTKKNLKCMSDACH